MEQYTSILASVSPVAVALSALAILIVSMVWYSPFMFGRAWIRHTGIRPGDMRPSDVRRGYIIATFVALLTAYLLGLVAVHTASNMIALLVTAGFIWLFVMLELLNGFTWRREPFALFLIQSFRSLFSLLAGALVFYFWS